MTHLRFNPLFHLNGHIDLIIYGKLRELELGNSKELRVYGK